jgi:hypothetical protein
MNILISYFKNNIVLLNNLVEISEKIIMKKEDLELLISTLIERPREKVSVDIAEEIDVSKCLGKCCKQIPYRYRKVSEIKIDEKYKFGDLFKYFYTKMETEFNISLEHVIV